GRHQLIFTKVRSKADFFLIFLLMYKKLFYFIIPFIFVFYSCNNRNIETNNENIPKNQDSIYAILKDMYSAEYLISQIRYITPYDVMSDKDLSRYIYSAVMKKHNINDSQLQEILKNISFNNDTDLLDSLYNELYKMSFK
ncbi:MAG TPA: hypothetical protein PKJ07_03565, partial [Bacteroidales bacterium]|nr:hypothetical protein [Bacteroidales bacterium]HOL74978.1 hypothetical protein [Bacteroidales bacterium]HPZ36330.1 hypothetical protein [Bacteroidales bacterium]